MDSIIPIIKELERIYDFLSKEFNFKYPKPIITIQSDGRYPTHGWYIDKRWIYHRKQMSEINICPEKIKKNTIIDTLIHEIIHYSNNCKKIKDCSDDGYHNKKFKEMAEFYGLNVKKDKTNGWANTSISKKLKNILKKYNINYNLFELYRKPERTSHSPTKMKKFTCGCTIVRCATDLKAKCLKCNQEFKIPS